MRLSSPDFRNNEFLPKKFSCQGRGVSPQLIIEEIPQEVKSLVLIVEDPDAPNPPFIHWVVYNIPPQNKIEEDSIPGLQGINSDQEENFVPACPPSGTHRYFFKLYALKEKLFFSSSPTKAEVEKAMKGKILSSCELIGLFKKN
jgi:Raf kinase inhibitor-like YbhB/YbcL family protein